MSKIDPRAASAFERLKPLFKNRKCDICKGRMWVFSNGFYELNVLGTLREQLKDFAFGMIGWGPPTYTNQPLLTATCSNCGHTHFFNCRRHI